MKRFHVFVLIVFISFSIFPASNPSSDSAEFRISAYKIVADEPTLNMYAVSALNYNLDSIATNSDIPLDMTDYLMKLGSGYLGAVGSDKPSEVLFSFRVEGNIPGSFKTAVEMTDFRLQTSDDGHVHTEQEIVAVDYMVVNSNVVFQSADAVNTEDGFEIAIKSLSSNSMEWEVSNKGSSAYSSDIWITRAGIAVILDDADYDGCLDGTYMSTVKISLEVYS